MSAAGYYTDVQVVAKLNTLIAAGTIPMPTSQTLYQIYTDANTVINMTLVGGASSCTQFCGIHFFFNVTAPSSPVPIAYYSVNAPCSAGCSVPGQTVFEALTTTGSHEIVETVTDPYFLTGWTSGLKNANEVCDPCGPVNYTSSTDGKVWSVNEWYSSLIGNCTSVGPQNNPTTTTTTNGASSAAATLSPLLSMLQSLFFFL